MVEPQDSTSTNSDIIHSYQNINLGPSTSTSSPIVGENGGKYIDPEEEKATQILEEAHFEKLQAIITRHILQSKNKISFCILKFNQKIRGAFCLENPKFGCPNF